MYDIIALVLLLLLSSMNVSIAVPVSPIIAFLKLISLSKDSNVFELLGSESAIFSPLLPVNTPATVEGMRFVYISGSSHGFTFKSV
jgi:hypothetical protein